MKLYFKLNEYYYYTTNLIIIFNYLFYKNIYVKTSSNNFKLKFSGR